MEMTPSFWLASSLDVASHPLVLFPVDLAAGVAFIEYPARDCRILPATEPGRAAPPAAPAPGIRAWARGSRRPRAPGPHPRARLGPPVPAPDVSSGVSRACPRALPVRGAVPLPGP